MTEQEKIEAVARAIARANGDEFADAFTNKTRWNAKRGMSGGRYRDINEPFQSDYLNMASAAIAALPAPSPASDVVERLVEAARAIHRSLLGKPVGGGDGETFTMEFPSATQMNELNAALKAIEDHSSRSAG
jgi:hypothetical protein